MAAYIQEVKYFQPEEMEAIMGSAATLRDKALIAVLYNCALRRGEVQFLTRMDYNEPRSMLRVTRLKKRESFWHEIVLWNQTRRLLREYLKSRKDHFDPLFLGHKPSCQGQAMGPDAVYFAFRAAAERAGIKLIDGPDERGNRHPGPHRVRHSFAVHAMNMGLPIEVLQEHMAHESIDTTMIYARVLNPVKKRQAMLMQASHAFAKF